MRTQFNHKIHSVYSRKFTEMHRKVGGDKFELVEAMIKAISALSDDTISYLRRPDTTLEDAEKRINDLLKKKACSRKDRTL